MKNNTKKYYGGIKSLLLITIFLVALCLVGCEDKEENEVKISVDTSDSQYGIETEQVNKIEFENSVGKVSYIKHEFTRTQFGTDILVVYFDFTNYSDDYYCLCDVANFRAYQDGMEIEGFYLDSEEGDDAWREIARGKTIGGAIAFKADNSPVELRVSPIIDGCFDSSVYQEQELSE